MAEALINAGDVLLISGNSVESLGDYNVKSSGSGVRQQRIDAAPVRDISTAYGAQFRITQATRPERSTISTSPSRLRLCLPGLRRNWPCELRSRKRMRRAIRPTSYSTRCFRKRLPTRIRAIGTVIPRRYENVAVLFCDVTNFTSYCDRHEPEDVVSRLDALFVIFERITARHGLEKIKTIGDGFMAAGDSSKRSRIRSARPLAAALKCHRP